MTLRDGEGREIIDGENPAYPVLDVSNDISEEDAEALYTGPVRGEIEMSPATQIRKLRVFLNGLDQQDPDLRDLREWLKLKIEYLTGR